jgi:hypothetical protein
VDRFDTAVLEMTVDRGAGDETVRFSNRPVSGAVDVLPRLAGAPEYSVEVGLWLWSQRSRSGFADAELINADGAIDWLIDAEVRDKPAVLLLGRAGDPLAAFETRATLSIDFVGGTSQRRIRVVFAAPDIALESTLQSDFYLAGAPNPRLEGLPVPISLGRVFQVPAVLYDEAPDIDYDCHVVMPAKIEEVASNGNPALTSQWEIRDRGFRMLVSPSGKITADLVGPQKASGHTTDDLPAGYPTSGHLNASANSDFTSWSSNKPVGYTLANDNVASPEKKLDRYNLTNTLRVINRDSSINGIVSTAPRLARNLNLVTGRWYGLRIDYVTTAGWTNQIGFLNLATAAAGTESDNTSVASHLSQSGVTTDQLLFFQAAGPVLKIWFGGGAVTGIDTEIRIDSIRLWDVEAGQVELVDLVPWVLDQAGWSGGVDTAGLAALNTAIGPHELGLWLAQSARATDVLDRLLAPFLAWRYIDELGTMRFGRLVEPADIAGDPVIEIGPEQIRAGEAIRPEDDLMPGLTDVYGARRNQQTLDESATAGTLSSLQERADRAAEFRIVARGDEADLHPFYAWAHNRCIFDSALQDDTSAQRERERTAAIAASRRRFWRVPMLLPSPVVLRPGQKVRITWPGYGLEAGQDVVLIGWARSYLSSAIDLICWS